MYGNNFKRTIFVAAVMFLLCLSTLAVAEAIRQGKVLQVINSDGYTYMHVQENSGKKVWVACSATKVNVKDVIEYPEIPPLANFQSKKLRKTFDKISFVSGVRVVWPTGRAEAPAPVRAPAWDGGAMPAAAPATEKIEEVRPAKKAKKISDSIESNGLIDSEPDFSIPNIGKNTQTVAISPDGRLLVAGTSQGVFMYDFEKRMCVKNEDFIHINSKKVSFSSDGRYLAIATSQDDIVKVIDVKNWREVAKLKLGGDAWNRAVLDVAFSPDDKFLAVGGEDNEARIYQVDNWSKFIKYDHPGDVISVNFSSDSNMMVTGCSDGIVRIYDVTKSKMIAQLNHVANISKGNSSYGAQFSKFDSLIMTGGGNAFRVFSVGDWQHVFNSGVNAAFSADGSGNANYASFSEDGKLWTMSDSTGTVYVFNTSTIPWKEVIQLPQYSNAVFSKFTPDGRTLVTDASNQPVRVYDTKTWDNISAIKGFGIKYIDNNWLVGELNNDVVGFDISRLTLFHLQTDSEKLGNKVLADEIVNGLKNLDKNIESKVVLLTKEKEATLSKLSNPNKDEFETQDEFQNRMGERNEKISEANREFNQKREEYRNEARIKRASMIREYEAVLAKLLEVTRKPIENLKTTIGSFSPEAEMFPLTVSTESRRSNTPGQATTWRGTVRVPRDKAKAFKEGIEKFKVTGEIQSTRSGDKELLNITLTSPDGTDTYKVGWKIDFAKIAAEAKAKVEAEAKAKAEEEAKAKAEEEAKIKAEEEAKAKAEEEAKAKIEAKAKAKAEAAENLTKYSGSKGSPIISLKSTMGAITFNHKKHQSSMFCSACHSGVTGPIEGFGKDFAHKTCKGCHLERRSGPTSCKECHKKN